MPFDVLKM